MFFSNILKGNIVSYKHDQGLDKFSNPFWHLAFVSSNDSNKKKKHNHGPKEHVKYVFRYTDVGIRRCVSDLMRVAEVGV